MGIVHRNVNKLDENGIMITTDNDEEKKISNDNNNITSLEVDQATITTDAPLSETSNCCSRRFEYEGIPEAKGYAFLAMGRGEYYLFYMGTVYRSHNTLYNTSSYHQL